MKTRNGFVSNSSSSSFIVGFDTIPKTVEELKKLLFKNDEILSAYDIELDTQKAADIIFDDIKNQKLATKKRLFDVIRAGELADYPETESNHPVYKLMDEFCKKYPKQHWGTPGEIENKDTRKFAQKIWDMQHAKWKAENKSRDVAAMKYVNETVLPKLKDKKVFIFEYEDHDPVGNVLEHGNVFNRVVHFHISMH